MRPRGILLVVGIISFMLVLGAFRPPNAELQEILSEEAYAEVMQEINLTMGDAQMNIDASYWADLGVVSDRLTAMFERVQSFWRAREVQPAVDFAGQALAATSALSLASGAMSGSQATQAVTELRAACRSCHTEFRERVGDGYRIRPGI